MARAAEPAGLLLAAGLSTRFGPADKLLAPLDERPLALHMAATLRAAVPGRLVAVCATPQLAALLEPLGYRIVLNPAPERGLGGSIALGAAAMMAGDGAGPLLLCLADMPRVPLAHLRALLAIDADVVATGRGGRAMPPALFGPGILPALAALSGPRGAAHLLADAVMVPCDPELLIDVDTPTALSRLRCPSA